MSAANKGNGGHGGKDSPLTALWIAASGASAGHHEELPGVSDTAAKIGHEADDFNAKTIIYVPILVASALVMTYLIVQGIFMFVNNTESRQIAEERAVNADGTAKLLTPDEQAKLDAVNKDKVVDYNARVVRLGTTNGQPVPKAYAGDSKPGAEAQARLEYMRQIDNKRNDVNGNLVSDPPFVRSFQPSGSLNSPEIYPENNRPENFVDPTFRKKVLLEEGWFVRDKTAFIPIDEATHLMLSDDKFKLKIAEKQAVVPVGTQGKAKMSTGGVTPPKPTAKVEEKPHH